MQQHHTFIPSFILLLAVLILTSSCEKENLATLNNPIMGQEMLSLPDTHLDAPIFTSIATRQGLVFQEIEQSTMIETATIITSQSNTKGEEEPCTELHCEEALEDIHTRFQDLANQHCEALVIPTSCCHNNEILYVLVLVQPTFNCVIEQCQLNK